MRKLLPSLVIALAVAIPTAAFAKAGTTTKSHAARFDKATIVTVSGQVQGVYPNKPTRNTMMSVTVKTDKEKLPVNLAPHWYVEKLALKKGDQLQVTGSRIMVHKKPRIIATRVVKGTQDLSLRNDDGKPLWHAPTKAEAQAAHPPAARQHPKAAHHKAAAK